MAIIVQEIAPQPRYDDKGQHDEMFVNLQLFHNGKRYGAMRIHRDEFPEELKVGDELKMVIERKPPDGPLITPIDTNEEQAADNADERGS